jgi:hypothetical protein
MASAGLEPDEVPLGELVSRLIDQGKDYARAEVGLVKAIANAKVAQVKLPAILLGTALLFVIGGVVTLCVTIALALATLIGPLAGGLIATLIVFGIAGALAYAGVQKLSAKP